MDSKTFFDNFETIANAPGGIARLRELVLDLAVRGKLTEQTFDEKRLDIAETDGPFEIPNNWLWSALEGIADYGGRGNASPNEIVNSDWVLDLEDIEKTTSRLIDRVLSKDRKTTSAKARFETGDVLYGKLRPYLDKVLVADSPGYCTTEIIPITPKFGINPQWLRISLKSPSFIGYVTDRSYGMKMPRLGTKDAKSSLHPVPPIEEQQRIVAKVDELMALCDELEAAQNQRNSIRTAARKSAIDAISTASTTEEFSAAWTRISNNWITIADTPESISSLRALILDLATLGKLGTQVPSEVVKTTQQLKDVDELFPRNWKFVAFNDGCNIEGGNQPPKSKFIAEPRSGYVRLFQIRDYGNSPVPTFIPTGSTNRFSKPGDVLIGRYGASIGKIFRAADGAYNVALAKFIYPKDLFRSDFIYWVLRSSRCQSIFTNMTRSAQAGFNKNDLAALNLPCPPLGEQDRIIVQLSSLMGLCDELEESLLRQVDLTRKLAGAMTTEVAA